VPDALGSVRQAVDATAAVVAAREWSPYGVESGGAQAGLGYTGEWFDAGVGLQYLRARWYDSQSGIFVTPDVVESEPPYQYVRCNPVNATDASGYIPERGAAGTEYFYSCRCGWLDIHHASSKRTLIQSVLDIGTANPTSTPEWQSIEQKGGQSIPLASFDLQGEFLVRRSGVIGRNSAREVALGIYIAWNNFWEEVGQGLNPVAGPVSAFSEEDLVSNLVGFHRGVREMKYGESEEESWKHFMELCGVVGYIHHETGDTERFVELQRQVFDQDLFENGPFILRKHRQWGCRPPRKWTGRVMVDFSSTCFRYSCLGEPDTLPAELVSITPQSPGRNWIWESGTHSYDVVVTESGTLTLGWDTKEYSPYGLNNRPLGWAPTGQ
jgi:RHS repeat-associated protein